MAMDAVPDNVSVPSVPADAPPAAASKRRRFQFSLRTLLVVTTLIGIWLGFLGAAAWRQRSAVAEITRLGGRASYDYQYVDAHGGFDKDAESSVPKWLLELLGQDVFHDVTTLNTISTRKTAQPDLEQQVADKLPELLPKFPKLKYLHVIGVQGADPVLRAVGRCTSLERLYLWEATPQTTDRGIGELAGLSRLKCLHVRETALTDESLRTIGRLTALEDLQIISDGISDQGLEHLEGLVHLKRLYLIAETTNPKLTDAGLAHLRGLQAIEELHLGGAATTEAGLDQLRKQLPNQKAIGQ